MANDGGGLVLTYGQIEALVGELHGIAPRRMSALRARLKHFKRLGFPPGVNTGRGRPAEYGPGQIVNVLFAFQLLELGFAPERSKLFLARIRSIIAIVVRNAAHGRLKRSGDSESVDFFLCLDPRALMSLEVGLAAADFSGDETAYWRNSNDLAEGLLDENGSSIRQSILNVSRLLGRAAGYLEEREIIECGAFYRALREWATDSEFDQVVNRERYVLDDIFGPEGEGDDGDR